VEQADAELGELNRQAGGRVPEHGDPSAANERLQEAAGTQAEHLDAHCMDGTNLAHVLHSLAHWRAPLEKRNTDGALG
jgi:hypothetical protein